MDGMFKGTCMRSATRTEIYRDKARECITLALEADDQALKDKLLAIARRWQSMAHDAETTMSGDVKFLAAKIFLEARTSQMLDAAPKIVPARFPPKQLQPAE
jgi:hypothetical protein